MESHRFHEFLICDSPLHVCLIKDDGLLDLIHLLKILASREALEAYFPQQGSQPFAFFGRAPSNPEPRVQSDRPRHGHPSTIKATRLYSHN